MQPLLPTVAGRERTLHHVKLAAGIVPEVGVITSGTVPEGGAAAAGGGAPLCAWLLAGSHNLSGAAWGKVEEVKAEGREGETDVRVRLSSSPYPIPSRNPSSSPSPGPNPNPNPNPHPNPGEGGG